MIQVFIIAASVVVRAGLEALLANQPTITVVGSAAEVEVLAQTPADLQPDVVLLESGFPEEEIAQVSLAGIERVALVVLTDTLQSWVTAFQAGARAVLPRTATVEELAAAIAAAAAGLVVLPPEMLETLLVGLPDTPPPLPLNQALTPREIEVLGMLAEGLGNKTIARQLGISEHTVKFHISSIFSKLNASSRTEAVTLGARQGLILL